MFGSKNLLTNVTETNKYIDVTFVRALTWMCTMTFGDVYEPMKYILKL